MENPDTNRRSRHARLWLLASGLPILFCAVFAFAFAYDAPYWDEWAYVQPIVRAFGGELAPSDFVVRVNEHIYFVSSLIVIPLARLTHWNLRWEIAVTLALYLATFVLFVRILLGVERDKGRRGSLWAAPLIACALFSGTQYAVWNWGLHISLAAAVFFTVAAILALASAPLNARRLALAGLCGWAATYSIGGGLGAWPAGAVVLLMRKNPGPAHARIFLLAWLGIGTAAAALYLSAGHAVPSASAQRVADPLALAFYVLAFMGSPLSGGDGGAAAVLGLVLVSALSVSIARSRKSGSKAFHAAAPIAMGLATVALTVGILTALKHAHEGVENAISSRFVPWPTLAWCGALVAVYAEFPELRLASSRVRGGVLAALVAVLVSSALGMVKAEERHDAFLLGRQALIDDPHGDALRFLHPDLGSLGDLRELLIKHRLTVFRDAASMD